MRREERDLRIRRSRSLLEELIQCERDMLPEMDDNDRTETQKRLHEYEMELHAISMQISQAQWQTKRLAGLRNKK